MFTPKFTVALVGALLLFGLGFASAWKIGTARLEKAADKHEEQLKKLTDEYAATLAAAEKKRAAVEEMARQDAIRANAEIQKALTRVQVKTREVVREVPVYVSPDVDRQYPVPVGFVRHYNAAITGAGGDPCPPASPGEPNDASSGVTMSSVASTNADNLGVCAEYRERALQWQRWYNSLRTTWNAQGSSP